MLGTVSVLRRYPVKSMLGEDVPDAAVTHSGLDRDRALALIHLETGKVASAKNPRLWRGMLKLAAAVAGSGVQITLADGKTIKSTDPGIDAVLSELLGRPVALTSTPPRGAALDRADPSEVSTPSPAPEPTPRSCTLAGSTSATRCAFPRAGLSSWCERHTMAR